MQFAHVFKGTPTAEHIKLVLGIIDGPPFQ
jgi:hypothetical protein